MAKKKIVLALSRWHHAVERLNAKAKELINSVEQTASATTLQSVQGEKQKIALQKQQAKMFENIELVMRIQKAVGEIRANLAQANASQKVSEHLAQLEAMNRQIKFLTTLSSVSNTDKVAIEFLADEEKRIAENQNRLFRNLTVEMISEERRENFEVKKDELIAQAHALSDHINDLNKHSVSLEIDEDLAKLFGQ